MKWRRFAIGCGAFGMLAVAGFVPATVSPRATGTICVGVIVDPRTIGGSVSDSCVNVKPGTTGVGVLEAAGHTVTFRRDGLMCTIDGLPKSGCSDVDNVHYWAYFHREPDETTWSYSNEGAGTYKPENRETEGWVYDNGVPKMPENIPASQICAGLVKATPTPTPTSKKTPHAAPHSHAPSTASTASPAAAPTSSTKPTTTKRHRHHRHPATPTAASTLPGANVSPTPAASTDSSGSGSATGALVAAGVIAVLATATVIGARRRRRPRS